MNTTYFTKAITALLLLALNILYGNSHAAERKICSNPVSQICSSASTCNDWFRSDLEPYEENKAIFEEEVATSGDEDIIKSCTWKVGFVSPSGATIYVREDEL